MGAMAAKFKIFFSLCVVWANRPMPIPRRKVLLNDFQRAFDRVRRNDYADLFGGF